MELCEHIDSIYRESYHILCILALLMNALNITVLSRQGMRSPTVVLLLWMAAVDGVETVFWLFYYLKQIRNRLRQYMEIFHINTIRNITLGLYGCNVWLAVALAVFRVIVVYFPFQGPSWCSISRVNWVSVAIVGLITIMYTPISWKEIMIERKFRVWENLTSEDQNQTLHESQVLWEAEWTTNAVVLKLVPCLLLLIFNGLLINTMSKTWSRQRRVFTKAKPSTSQTNPPENVETQSPDFRISTGALIVVLTIFISMEIPRGIIRLWWVVNYPEAYALFPISRACLNRIFQYITIIGNAVNFWLYCAMSSKFRRTLYILFRSITTFPCRMCRNLV